MKNFRRVSFKNNILSSKNNIQLFNILKCLKLLQVKYNWVIPMRFLPFISLIKTQKFSQKPLSFLFKGPIRRSSQTRRVASQTCRVKVLEKGVVITRWPQCLIYFFARRMSLVSSDSTCFNRREDKMLFSINICTRRYNYLQLILSV